MMWIIHIVCVLFFIPALIFTIPLHLILNAVSRREKSPTMADQLNQMTAKLKAGRPAEVNEGKRSMTWAEGWTEIKNNPKETAVGFVTTTATFMGLMFLLQTVFDLF